MDQRGDWGQAVVEYKLYVEGGGDSKALRIECQIGFRAFLEKAGLHGAMPRIVACGSRNKTYDMFCTAITQGQKAFLLVDSEQPVSPKHMTDDPERWQPWEHLQQADAWTKPVESIDTNCHLMVQVMESWFLTDKDTLADFFGQGFHEGALPVRGSIETVSKETVDQGLKTATRACKTQSRYKKGQHSFKILVRINPDKVCAASPWAKRFVDTLLRMRTKNGHALSESRQTHRRLRIQ